MAFVFRKQFHVMKRGCYPGVSAAGIPDDLQKSFMDPGVFIQFRVKSKGQLIIVLYANDPVFDRSQNPCIIVDVKIGRASCRERV